MHIRRIHWSTPYGAAHCKNSFCLGAMCGRDIGRQDFSAEAIDKSVVPGLLDLTTGDLPRNPAAHVACVWHAVEAGDVLKHV